MSEALMDDYVEVKSDPNEKKTTKARSTNWCFTWNNYTPEDIESIKDTWISPRYLDMRCVVFEQEIAPTTGTPHLQGFFVTKTVKSFNQIKQMLPGAVSFRMMNGRIDQNVQYCTKDKTGVVVLGDVPMSQKQQAAHGIQGAKFGVLGEQPGIANHNWKQLQEAAASGMSRKECAATFAYMFGQYPKGFDRTFDEFRPKPKFDLREKYGSLFEWQAELLKIVDLGPHPRHVHWIWSEMGDVGKTDMTKHLVSSNDFTPLGNAATRDLACAWKGKNTVIDLARSEENINYSFIEMAKNGMVFSSKYESQTKLSENGFAPTFVICFANVTPDLKKLSSDRWQIYRINADKTWTKQRIVSGMLADEIASESS